jgi:multiple sugar transport system permease protein
VRPPAWKALPQIDNRRRRTPAALLVATLFLLPLVFMVLASLRPQALPPPDGFQIIPPEFAWTNYRLVFNFIPLAAQLRNSLFVVALAVPITVVVASMAGFAIVSSPPARRRTLIVITVLAQMVPVTALWVPRFILFRKLGLTDTPWPLIAPALMATAPFYVLIFALAYHRIPRHIFEAAELDGASPLSVWARVAFPLARPAAFAVAVLAFVAHWSNFVDPLLYLSRPEQYTVPLGLRALQTLEPQNFPILLAASVIAAAPAVLGFLIAQRAFFKGTLEVG